MSNLPFNSEEQQKRQEELSNFSPAIVAKAQREGISPEEQAALDPATWHKIANPDYFALRYGPAAAQVADKMVAQYKPEIVTDNRSLLRTAGDMATDFAAGAARMPSDLASLPFHIFGDMYVEDPFNEEISTQKTDNAGIFLSQNAQKIDNSIHDAFYSDTAKQLREISQLNDIARKEIRERKDKIREENGESSFMRTLKSAADEAADAFDSITDAGQFSAAIFSNLPQLVLGWGIGSAGSTASSAISKAAAKSVSKKSFLSKMKDLGIEALTSPGYYLNIGMETASTAAEVIEAIGQMSPEELRQSDKFREREESYKRQGMSDREAFEAAKKDTQAEAAQYVIPRTAALVSAAGLPATQFLSRLPTKSVAGGMTKNLTGEFFEESLSEGGETLFGNLAQQKQGYNVPTGEGVVTGLVKGGVTGVGLAGTASAIGSTINTARLAAADKGKLVAESTKGSFLNMQEIVRKARETTASSSGSPDATNTDATASTTEVPQQTPISKNVQDFAERVGIATDAAASASKKEDIATFLGKNNLNEFTESFIDESKTLSENILNLEDEAKKLSKSSDIEDHEKALQLTEDISKLQKIADTHAAALAKNIQKATKLLAENKAVEDTAKKAEASATTEALPEQAQVAKLTDGDKRLLKDIISGSQEMLLHLQAPKLNQRAFDKAKEKINSLRGVTLYSENFLKKSVQENTKPKDVDIAKLALITQNIIAEQATPQMKENILPALNKVLLRDDLSETEKKVFEVYKNILNSREQLFKGHGVSASDTSSGKSRKLSNIVKQVVTGQKTKSFDKNGYEYLSINGHLKKIIDAIASNDKSTARLALTDLHHFTQSQINKFAAMNESKDMKDDSKRGRQRNVKYASYVKNEGTKKSSFETKEIFTDMRIPGSRELYRQAEIETSLLIGTYNALANAFSDTDYVDNASFDKNLSITSSISFEKMKEDSETKEDRNASSEGVVVVPSEDNTQKSKQLNLLDSSIDPITGKAYPEINGDESYDPREVFNGKGKVKESVIKSAIPKEEFKRGKSIGSAQRSAITQYVQGALRYLQRTSGRRVYTRRSSKNDGTSLLNSSLGIKYLAEWGIFTPNILKIFNANYLANLQYYELDTSDSASIQKFIDAAQQAAQDTSPIAIGDILSQEGYKGHKLFLSRNGQAGVAISPEGRIVTIFSPKASDQAPKNTWASLTELAISAGATSVVTLHTELPRVYSYAGFRAVSRTEWNPDSVPGSWNQEEILSQYINNKPDIVFMVYDQNYFGGYSPEIEHTQGQMFTGENAYEQAEKAQKEALEKLEKAQKNKEILSGIMPKGISPEMQAFVDAAQNEYADLVASLETIPPRTRGLTEAKNLLAKAKKLKKVLDKAKTNDAIADAYQNFRNAYEELYQKYEEIHQALLEAKEERLKEDQYKNFFMQVWGKVLPDSSNADEKEVKTLKDNGYRGLFVHRKVPQSQRKGYLTFEDMIPIMAAEGLINEDASVTELINKLLDIPSPSNTGALKRWKREQSPNKEQKPKAVEPKKEEEPVAIEQETSEPVEEIPPVAEEKQTPKEPDWGTENEQANKTEAATTAVHSIYHVKKDNSLVHKLTSPITTLTKAFTFYRGSSDKIRKEYDAVRALLFGNKYSEQILSRIFKNPLGSEYQKGETLYQALASLFSGSKDSALNILTNEFNTRLKNLLNSTDKKVHDFIKPLRDIDFNDAGLLAYNLKKKNLNSILLFLSQNANGELEADNTYFQKALLGYLTAYVNKVKELAPGNTSEAVNETPWEEQFENDAVVTFTQRYGASSLGSDLLTWLRQNMDNTTSATDFTNSLVAMAKPYLGLSERSHVDAATLNSALTSLVQSFNDILLDAGLISKHTMKITLAENENGLREVIHVSDNGQQIYKASKSRNAKNTNIETLTFYKVKEPDENSKNALERSLASVYFTIGSSVLDRLFLAEDNKSFVLGNVPEVEQTANRTNTPLSDKQKEGLDARQKKEYFFNKAMYNFIMAIGETSIAKYLNRWYPMDASENKQNGEETLLDQYTNVTRTSLQGKRTNVHTSFLNLQYFLSELISYPNFEDLSYGLFAEDESKAVSYDSLPIHFRYMISSMGRYMIRGGMHPQGDKILREVILPAAYTIDLSDAENRENYFRGIAQAFGVKVQRERRGTETNTQNVEQIVWEKMQPVLKAKNQFGKSIWEEFVELVQTNPSMEDLIENQAIKNLMNLLMEENVSKNIDKSMVTLHALFDLAHIYNPETQNIDTTTEHTSRFYLEADGISSGAANSILLFDTSLLVQNGKPDVSRMQYMIRAGLGIGLTGSYAEIYSKYAGGKDIYGALGYSLQEFINSVLNQANKAILASEEYGKTPEGRANGYAESIDIFEDDEELDANLPVNSSFSFGIEGGDALRHNTLGDIKRFKAAYASILSLLSTLGNTDVKELKGVKPDTEPDALGQLNNFLIDRGFIKGPLTQIQYGAGSRTVAAAIVKAMDEAINQKITERNIALNIDNNTERAAQLEKEIRTSIEAVNRLLKNNFLSYSEKKVTDDTYGVQENFPMWEYIKEDKVSSIDLDALLKRDSKLKEFSLAPYYDNLTSTIDSLITKPLSKQIENNIYGSEFSTNKRLLTGFSNTLTVLTSQLFIEKLKAIIKENKGYTQAQYKQIQALLAKWEPLIENNIMAVFRNSDAEQSLYEYEEVNQTFSMMKQDFLSASELGTTTYGGSLDNPFSEEGRQSALVPSAAGVTILPKTVQGMAESVIMQIMALKNATGLDVFDGFNMPINQVNTLGRLANEAVYNAWVNTNVFKNMGEAIDNFFINFAEDELAKKMLNKMFTFSSTSEIPQNAEAWDLWAMKHPVEASFYKNVYDLKRLGQPNRKKEPIYKFAAEVFVANNSSNSTSWIKSALIPARYSLAKAAQKTDIKHFLLQHLTDISVDQMGGAALPFIHNIEASDYTFRDNSSFIPISYNKEGNNAYEAFMDQYAKMYSAYMTKFMYEPQYNINNYIGKLWNNKEIVNSLDYTRFTDEANSLADLALSDVSDLNITPVMDSLNWTLSKLKTNANARTLLYHLQGSLLNKADVRVVRLKPTDLHKDSIIAKYFKGISLNVTDENALEQFILSQAKEGMTQFFPSEDGDRIQAVVLVKDSAAFLRADSPEEKKQADKVTAKNILHEVLHVYTAGYILGHVDIDGSLLGEDTLTPDEKINLQHLLGLYEKFKKFANEEENFFVQQVSEQILESGTLPVQLLEFISYCLSEPEMEAFLSAKSVTQEETLASKLVKQGQLSNEKMTKAEALSLRGVLRNLRNFRKEVYNFMAHMLKGFFKHKPSTFLDELRFSTTHILRTNKAIADTAITSRAEDINAEKDSLFLEAGAFYAVNIYKAALQKARRQGYPATRAIQKARQAQSWAREQAIKENNNRTDFAYLYDIQNSSTYHAIVNIGSLFKLNPSQLEDFIDYFTILVQAYQKDKAGMQRGFALISSMYSNLTKDMFSGSEDEKLSKYELLTTLPELSLDGNKNTTIALPALIALNEVSTELQGINAKLDIPHRYKKAKEDSLNNWLRGVGNNALDRFDKLVAGEKRRITKEDEAMKNMLQTASAIAHDAKTRIADYMPTIFNDGLTLADRFTSNMLYNIAESVSKGLGKINPTSTTSKVVKGALSWPLLGFASVFDENQGTATNNFIRDKIINSKSCPEPIRRLLHDLFHPSDESIADFHVRLAKLKAAIDQHKQRTKSQYPIFIREMFQNNEPTQEEWESLHLSLGSTDLACLDSPLMYEKIEDWLDDPNELLKEIDALEAELDDVPTQGHLLKRGRQLAHYMVTKEAGLELRRNPFAICKLSQTQLSEEQFAAYDHLISLYALKELPEKDKKILSKQFKNNKEAVIKTLNIINSFRGTEYAEKANLLNSSAKEKDVLYHQKMRMHLNYYKGYIPSMRTDGTSLIVESNDPITKKKLIRQGYKYVGDYGLEPSKGYYYSSLSHQAVFNEGLIRIVHSTYSGVTQDTGNSLEGVAYRERQSELGKKAFTKVSERYLTKGYNKQTGEAMIPVYSVDTKGNIVISAWEAHMSPEKIRFIQEKRSLPDMMGMWASRQQEEIFSKQFTKEVANQFVDLYTAATPEQQKNSFIDITDDKQLTPVQRDAVKLIPWDTLAEIRQAFGEQTGKSGIFIRRDLFIDCIGERSASVTDIWSHVSNIDEKHLEKVEELTHKLMGERAFTILAGGEQILQSAVSMARNIIVVKSISVMLQNSFGNFIQLLLRGVPLKNITRDLPKILSDTEKYAQSFKQLNKLKLAREATRDPEVIKKLTAQIELKEKEIKNLEIYPILHEFSILEDLGRSEEDLMLTRGKMGEWADAQVKRLIPKPVLTPLKYLFLTKDTAAYQFLEKATQYGDFIAKAILYNHLRENEQLSEKEALKKINKEYVNYGINAGRLRSYLESIGFLWFFNYKLRTVAIALSILRTNPVRALFLMMSPNVFSDESVLADNLLAKLIKGNLWDSVGLSMLFRAFGMQPIFSWM